jgi:ATP-binding protein involved in chromosome partitioning
MPTPQEVLDRLRAVPYPGFTRDIVSFGLVKDVEIGGRGTTITLTPTSDRTDVLDEIRGKILESLQGLELGTIEFLVEEPPRGGLAQMRPKAKVGNVKRIVAVASGKGGVGKSTVATNLALSLQRLGRDVGLLDADVYGPSIPTMLGIQERPRADEEKRIEPIVRYGMRVISMGLFVDEAKPIIWRGPMITKLLVEFVRNVLWGDLDYLILDLPPGTGDAQLTICQQVPLAGGVIVTTPQEVALLDVKRGVTMFREVNVPVLGVVDNMSVHVCGRCGRREHLFGHGSADMARDLGIPMLGSIPLVRDIREAADRGIPLVVADPEHAQSLAFLEIARKVEEALDRAPAKSAAPIVH